MPEHDFAGFLEETSCQRSLVQMPRVYNVRASFDDIETLKCRELSAMIEAHALLKRCSSGRTVERGGRLRE
jgi:hypothetical protein